jgi:predicted small lipoprotein YifL
MVPAIQELPVTRPVGIRLAVIGALAAALLLAGCGRKGPLDPPPASSQLQQGAPGPGASPARAPQQAFDENGRPVAPQGPKARQFLDWLLD